jgi:hypothetical protein
MTFENDDVEKTADGEGTGDSTQTSQVDSSSTEGSTGETQASESTEKETGDTRPTVDYSSLDLEELYKNRPELKPASIEDVLNSEEVRKHIQSEKDKEIAKERRRGQEEMKKRDRDETNRRIEAEKRRLLDEEDYEGLGKYVAEEDGRSKELLEAAAIFKETGEQYIREHPDYQTLGDDRVAEIIDDVKRKGGNVFDIQVELARAIGEFKFKDATSKATATIEERIKQEVEAALTSAGVTKREQQVQEGQTASNNISGGGGAKTSTQEKTYAQASTEYGDGDMSWEEFAPYKKAHEKQTNR